MLKIFINGENKTVDLKDFNGSVSVNISTVDYIEIGYYKPISDLYIEIETANATNETLSFNLVGDTDTEIAIDDYTKDLTQSGFINWDRSSITPAKYTLNGSELYWYRIKASGDMGTLVLKGIGLVFSNDNDLKEDYPDIMDSLPSGDTSFIKFHKAAKDNIIQSLNNMSIRKASTTNVAPKRIDEFDILDIKELRIPSKYMVLGFIFKWLSDQIDDKYSEDSKNFLSLASNFLNMPSLSIDLDDDGQKDQFEENRVHSTVLQRR